MRTLLSVGLSGALLIASSHAENLLENGSFEFPKITGRTPAEKGGDPTKTEEKTLWIALERSRDDKGGRLAIGLTDEIAHEGKQSLFVDFEKISALGKRVFLRSELLPIQPNQKYRISLWGRLDRDRPLAMDERRPHLLVQVEFFAADQETQIGTTEHRVQMIPGAVIPGLGPRILFTASKWNEYYTEVKSPTNSAFVKVSFGFQTPREEGETDGLLFLDGAAVDGPRGSIPLTDKETTEEATTPEDAAATPTSDSAKQNQSE